MLHVASGKWSSQSQSDETRIVPDKGITVDSFTGNDCRWPITILLRSTPGRLPAGEPGRRRRFRVV
jgi:hypothetical protein